MLRSSILLIACSLIMLLVALHAAGYKILAVQSNSMAPQFQAGDAVAVRVDPRAALSSGQVVTYRSTFNRRVLISHRVIRVDVTNNQVITRGDALGQADPPIRRAQIMGQVVAVLPHFGSVLNSMHSPYVLALGVYLPAVALASWEAWRLVAAFTYTHYKVLD